MIERLWRRDALRVHLVSHIGVVVASAVVLVAGQPATAQYASDFEAPLYTGSPAGDIITDQDEFYIPVPDSQDGLVYTYVDNVLGVPTNPSGGGAQFAGVTGGDPALPVPFARAQRDIVYGDGTGAWTISFDIAATFIGALPSAQNIGSFSTQPSTTSAGFIALARWTVPDTAANWDADYVWFDAAGVSITESVDDPGFQNLAVDHWYRWSTTFNFDTNQILEVSITDLTTNVTITNNPEFRYLRGGAAGGAPTPTGFRLFAGSSTAAGNTLAFDNVDIDLASGTPSGACCFEDETCGFGTEAECAAAGGTYRGDWIGCSENGCITIPKVCGPDAGPCDKPNKTPGCELGLCCALVCLIDPFCCSVFWNDECVDIAAGLPECEGEPPPPPMPCPDLIYDNGTYNLTNGGRPSAGWTDAGMIDDFETTAPLDFTCVQVAMLDNTGKTDLQTMRIQIFDLNNIDGMGGGDGTIAGAGSYALAVPVCDNTSSVAAGTMTLFDTGDDAFGFDVILFDATGPKCALPAGDYGFHVTFPGTGAVDFWNTANPAGVSPDCASIWGDTVDLPSPFACAGSPEFLTMHFKLFRTGNPCPWDLDDDGNVGVPDLLELILAWGTDPGGPPDFNGDGDVGVPDLLELILNWGACP